MGKRRASASYNSNYRLNNSNNILGCMMLLLQLSLLRLCFRSVCYRYTSLPFALSLSLSLSHTYTQTVSHSRWLLRTCAVVIVFDSCKRSHWAKQTDKFRYRQARGQVRAIETHAQTDVWKLWIIVVGTIPLLLVCCVSLCAPRSTRAATTATTASTATTQATATTTTATSAAQSLQGELYAAAIAACFPPRWLSCLKPCTEWPTFSPLGRWQRRAFALNGWRLQRGSHANERSACPWPILVPSPRLALLSPRLSASPDQVTSLAARACARQTRVVRALELCRPPRASQRALSCGSLALPESTLHCQTLLAAAATT